jgi:alanine dehydrogenase
VLQDTNAPLIFLDDDNLAALRPNSLIVDVSCGEAMGFICARPTRLRATFAVGANVTYYAVDHSPSYLWDSATWEISEALLPYLPTVIAGRDAWQADQTVRRAIEILDGTVLNPNILSFQNRHTQYPHARRGCGGRESA